jgi:hypothetical protein
MVTGATRVVWWDPARLGLDVQPPFGIRREDLIVDIDRETVERQEAVRCLAAGA